MLKKINPDAAVKLMALAEKDVKKRWHLYEQLAQMVATNGNGKKPEACVITQARISKLTGGGQMTAARGIIH